MSNEAIIEALNQLDYDAVLLDDGRLRVTDRRVSGRAIEGWRFTDILELCQELRMVQAKRVAKRLALTS